MKEKFNFTPFPELDTSRLKLRQLVNTDDQKVLLLRSDPQVNEFLVRPRQKDINEARAFIAKINNGIKENQWIYWAIELQDTMGIVGTICLWNFSDDKLAAEVGYELLPDKQGKGIMNEALEAVIEFGFTSMGLTTIKAYTHRENQKSTHLLLKKGFILDKNQKDNENENHDVFVLVKS